MIDDTTFDKYIRRNTPGGPNMVDFASYEPNGKIGSFGRMAEDTLADLIAQGQPFVKLDNVDANTVYVNLAGATPTVVPRPVLSDFDKNNIVPNEETMIPGVPPCLVRFYGPMEGAVDHPSLSDLKLGFGASGSYDVMFDPFPYMPVRKTIVVKPGIAVDLGNANIKVSL